jgi:hypothetical protein
MLLSQTTQPCPNLWTPGEVIALMSAFSTLVVGGFFAGWRSIIALKRDAALAVIAASKADGKADANATALGVLQHQVTQVALNTPPPQAASPRSPVVPATFADAQLRAAADPDCPPQDVTTTTTTTTTTPPATEG